MPGTLPSATSRRRLIGIVVACIATLALSAALAGPASGATRVSYRAFDGSAPKTFFDKGGLQLIGECDTPDEMTITARSTVSDAMLHANEQGQGNNYFEEDDFDAGAGDQQELLGTLGGLGDADSNAGQIVYGRPGGTNVSVDWLAEQGDGYAQARDCVFVGTARFVDSGSSYRANFRFDDPTPATTFFNHGGLKLIGTCMPGGLDVTAKTSTDHAMIHANGQYFGNGVDAEVDNDFNIADPAFNVGAASGGTVDNSVGQIVYAKPGGTNVTVDWAAEDDGDALGRDCIFNGVARVRSSGDAKRVNFRVPSGDAGPTTFFNQGGLKFAGVCSSGDLNVFVSTASDHAMIHFNGQDVGDAQSNESDFFSTDADDAFELFGTLGLGNGEKYSSGQIIYSAFQSGTNVTVRWAGEDDGDAFGSYPCAFVGTAEIGTK